MLRSFRFAFRTPHVKSLSTSLTSPFALHRFVVPSLSRPCTRSFFWNKSKVKEEEESLEDSQSPQEVLDRLKELEEADLKSPPEEKDEEFTPSLEEWTESGIRKPSKYPRPPVADTAGIAFADDSINPVAHPELPWTIDRSEGVTVLKFKVGPYKDEELILAHGQFTLEWAEPSPPPLHQMEESPIIKEHPDYVAAH